MGIREALGNPEGLRRTNESKSQHRNSEGGVYKRQGVSNQNPKHDGRAKYRDELSEEVDLNKLRQMDRFIQREDGKWQNIQFTNDSDDDSGSLKSCLSSDVNRSRNTSRSRSKRISGLKIKPAIGSNIYKITLTVHCNMSTCMCHPTLIFKIRISGCFSWRARHHF